MPDFLSEKLKEKLMRSGLIAPGDTVFIACSGGPDSTALFHLLCAFRKEWKLSLGLLHFHHGLRPKSASADESFVRKLAKTYRVPFYSARGKVKQLAAREKFSTEEAAREARYEFFLKAAAKHKFFKIATAHTLDDQAETVLMRILQGTGLRGLCAIRSCLQKGKTQLVRPLLDFSKQELLDYLKQNRFLYRVDPSNASTRHLRNRIRLDLIPRLLKEFHPKVKEAMARVPAILCQDAEYLETMERKIWKEVFLKGGKGSVFFRRAKFLRTAPSMQFRLIDRALKYLDPKSGLSFEAWQTLRGGLTRPHFRHSLPKDIDLALTPLKLSLYKK